MDTVDTIVVKGAFDTACLIALYRALASERPDGRIQDPYARMLAGERGKELEKTMTISEIEMWAIVIRTKVYDDIIMRLAKEGYIDTIINLNAGFDARPYRLALPRSLRWIEIDHPEILAYKREKLAQVQPSCGVEQLFLSITDDEARKAVLAQATQSTTKILVLTEGLLRYLPHAAVVSLAKDLWDEQNIGWWLTQILPTRVVKQQEITLNKRPIPDAQVRSTSSNEIVLLSECGWEIEEFRYIFREILRYKIPLKMPRVARLLAYLLPRIPTPTYHEGGFALLKSVGREDASPFMLPKKNGIHKTFRAVGNIFHWLGLW